MPQNFEWTLAAIAVLIFLGGFCLGVYFGMMGSEVLEAESYRRGRTAGFGEAQRLYSQVPVERVPTVQARRPA